ncbi:MULTISPECIES: hypothetical protein [unclassified Bradyrhizobium]|uniref:hypothetical protein n=1 Tax=unclassified Bradyrhizobium TaxID=2631580 RepID=UPI002479D9A6|nr:MULTISPECIES: hypothetical protein [unclassified Bradyrhizobium]WGR72804.1 hypothetical protein MTX24_07855 [Bradyrhizobium sp. ISRA426]WGR77639.1 hypothetical protein MTX21_32810 [Bradyrhizobium sp. ISRA430]WGR88044.1 hypothetical protein MTX25_07860 [Bradyrhizobium sp. ISRA432]
MKQKPTGLYTRTASAFFLDSNKLNLPAVKKVAYVDAVNIELQYARSGVEFGAASRPQ